MSTRTIRDFDRDVDRDATSDMDVRAIGRAIRRKKTWLIWPPLVAFVLIAAFVNIISPRYTAEAQVLLENQENFFTRPDRLAPTADPLIDADAVASQVQVLTSRDLARRAIRDLNLIDNPEFNPPAGFLSQLSAMLGLSQDPARQTPEERVLDTYLEKLTVFSPTKTRVLSIDFQSKDPELAARVANKVADVYIELQSDAKRGNAKSAADSLSGLISDLRVKVAKADAAAQEFRAKTGLLAGTNNMTIAGQQLAELNSELSKSRTSQADAQAKATLIRDMIKQGRIAEVPDVANNELVRRTAEQRIAVRAQLALESRTLMGGHPRIKELTAQLADFDSQLKSIIDQTARALDNDAKIAGARVANLETSINQQKTLAGSANVDEVRLRELERQTQVYKEQLDTSTTKYQEALAREKSQATPADARIVSRALPPQLPSFPKKVPMIVFGTVATLVLALGTIVSGELLSGRPHVVVDERIDDVPPSPVVRAKPAAKKAARMPFLARLREFGQSAAEQRDETPAKRAKRAVEEEFPEDEAFDRERGRAAEDEPLPPPQKVVAPGGSSVASVAGHIMGAAIDGRGARIVATSLKAAASSTTTAIALGRRLARDGRAIIVDLDENSTKLHQLAAFGTGAGDVAQTIPGMPGLGDLLVGKASFAEVIHRDFASRLHFIPAGNGAAINFDDFDLVLDALVETYDHVVLLAPALDRPEVALALAPHSDFFVVTVQGSAGRDAVRQAHDDLLEAGAAEVLVMEGAQGRGNARDVA